MSLLGKWRKSKHQWVEESLSAYMDGELPPAEKARVEQHLQECEACAQNLATLRQTVSLLKQLPAKQAPRSFAVRPAKVKVKRAAAPPAWGYGLLKGATALAALLLVLLVGGDLALHLVGAPLASFAPAAPAPEVALAPAAEPSMAPAVEEEETMLDQGKAQELSPTPAPPTNLEEPPAPMEAPDAYHAQEEAPTAAARAEGAAPAGTPAAPVPSGEGPTLEGEGVGAAVAETPTAGLATPGASPTGGGETEPTAESAPATTLPEATEEHAPAPAPTSTPPVLVMADEPQREAEVQEFAGEQPREEALPFSPLRLAELVTLATFALLGAATAMSAWLRRRRG